MQLSFTGALKLLTFKLYFYAETHILKAFKLLKL